MRIKRINGMFTIASQMELSQMRRVADAGYKSIICMRPDGEGRDQPDFDVIARSAQIFGIETRHLPLKPSDKPELQLEAFIEAVDEMPLPILAYCRSGMRPATLWSKWEHAMSGLPEEGERRVGPLKAGAFDGGGMTISGQRASPTAGPQAGQKETPAVVDLNGRRQAQG